MVLHRNTVDLTGRRFGRLVVVAYAGRIVIGKAKLGRSTWLCRCDCGGESVVHHGNLTSGNTATCGCGNLEASFVNITKAHAAWMKSIEGKPRARPHAPDPLRMTKEIRQWKKAVLQRDGGKCQVCGTTEKIVVHHLLSFRDHPEHRISVENGAAVCVKHHRGFHARYGTKGFTPENFQEYLRLNRPSG